MINASTLFQNTIKERTNFIESATITFRDNRKVDLGPKDFSISNNNVNDGANVNGFPLGVAISRSIKIEIANFEDQYSDYDFNGAKIKLSCSLKLDNNSTETINYGLFTVITPETYGDTIIVTAVDDMYKCDKAYETNLAFPNRLDIILQDIASRRGFLIKKENFTNCDFMVMSKPKNVTDRQVIGYIAMIAGGNARFDRYGYLEILTYDREALSKVETIIDGGTYLFTDSSEIDGGDFTYNTGANIDGGSFEFGQDNYHVLSSWKNLKVDVDDVVITGIQTKTSSNKEDEKNIKLYGKNGYVLSINNPLIAEKEDEAIKLIGDLIIGIKFRPFSGDYIAYPLAEFMDLCVVNDRKGNSYLSIITDVNFSFGGFTRLKNTAVSAIRNSSSYFSNATQAIVEASKMVEKEKNEREVAQDLLFQKLSNANGMYYTEYEAGDGSIIRFFHDKPNLDDSQIVWKFTIDAFGISTDGGKTYPYGMDISGTAILEKLYASKISADYINGGILRIGGLNNINGQIYIIDKDGEQCGVINNIGISIYSKVNKKRVLISPIVGFLEQDAESGEFFGEIYQNTNHVERANNILSSTKIYASHNDRVVINFLREESGGSVSDGTFWAKKYYEYYYTHDEPLFVWNETAPSQIDSEISVVEIQLPEVYKGKLFNYEIESKVNEERYNDLINNKKIYLKTWYDGSYNEKATGKKWEGYEEYPLFSDGTLSSVYLTEVLGYIGQPSEANVPSTEPILRELQVKSLPKNCSVNVIEVDYDNAIIKYTCHVSAGCSIKDYIENSSHDYSEVYVDIPEIYDVTFTVIC